MAAYREMGEELGITKEWAQDNILNLPPVVAAFPSLLSYVIPPLYKKADKVGIGQTIQWYVFAWPYTEDPPKLGAEFSHMNWFKTSQVYSLKVTPFKVQMYRELMRWLQEVWV
jgi:8-oxo-dGTP pyrophosphatase MutT (NUDIX family)